MAYKNKSKGPELERYAVRKGGATRLWAPGEIRADGVVVLHYGPKRVPVTLSAVCDRLGIDPKTVTLDGPAECLGRLGANPGGVEIMTAAEASGLDAAAADAALDAAVPGLSGIVALDRSVRAARLEYEDLRRREIARGTVMTAREPDPADAARLAELLAANPRAAAYLDAERQHEGASWADNTGRGAAGKRAMEILLAGGSAAEARAAMAVRREFVD